MLILIKSNKLPKKQVGFRVIKSISEIVCIASHFPLLYVWELYLQWRQIGIFKKFVQIGIWLKHTGGSVLMCYMWNVFYNNYNENSIPLRGQNPSQPSSTFIKILKNIIGSQYHLTLHDQFSIYSPNSDSFFLRFGSLVEPPFQTYHNL